MSSSRLPYWRSRRAGNIVEYFAIREEWESIVFYPVREGFLPQYALPPPIFASIDIAARPAIYFRHG
jgi:hypothetical protein